MKSKNEKLQEKIEKQYLDYVKNGIIYKRKIVKGKKQIKKEEFDLTNLLFSWKDDFDYFESGIY